MHEKVRDCILTILLMGSGNLAAATCGRETPSPVGATQTCGAAWRCKPKS